MNILELAIGTGSHTLFLAKTLMQRGATLVCTEISPKMLELAHEKLSDPDNEFV
jgi:ubiquinone/menaquinone biosynthesis C-methylase UbiE